jgi:hypothetical protein
MATRHCTINFNIWINSSLSHNIYLESVLIFIRLCIQSDRFLQAIRSKFCSNSSYAYAFYIPVHIFFRYLTAIFCERSINYGALHVTSSTFLNFFTLRFKYCQHFFDFIYLRLIYQRFRPQRVKICSQILSITSTSVTPTTVWPDNSDVDTCSISRPQSPEKHWSALYLIHCFIWKALYCWSEANEADKYKKKRQT